MRFMQIDKSQNVVDVLLLKNDNTEISPSSLWILISVILRHWQNDYTLITLRLIVVFQFRFVSQ